MKYIILLSIFLINSCSHTPDSYGDISNSNADGTVNVVIEIPAGSNQKWEVKKNGALEWDVKNGKKRFINFLPYPGNYGMIPKTLCGDGDPFDVLVLGAAKKRGAVSKVKVIGALKTLDNGEEDDKLIAVFDESELDKVEIETTGLYKINTIKQLKQDYPGSTEIISLFFQNYKGRRGSMKIIGFVELDQYPKWKRFIEQRYME